MVNILPLDSLSEQVNFGRSVPGSDLGELGSYIISESTKILNIYRSTGHHLFLQVFSQSFPDDKELSLGLKRFEIGSSSLSRIVVLAWILIAVF